MMYLPRLLAAPFLAAALFGLASGYAKAGGQDRQRYEETITVYGKLPLCRAAIPIRTRSAGDQPACSITPDSIRVTAYDHVEGMDVKLPVEKVAPIESHIRMTFVLDSTQKLENSRNGISSVVSDVLRRLDHNKDEVRFMVYRGTERCRGGADCYKSGRNAADMEQIPEDGFVSLRDFYPAVVRHYCDNNPEECRKPGDPETWNDGSVEEFLHETAKFYVKTNLLYRFRGDADISKPLNDVMDVISNHPDGGSLDVVLAISDFRYACVRPEESLGAVNDPADHVHVSLVGLDPDVNLEGFRNVADVHRVASRVDSEDIAREIVEGFPQRYIVIANAGSMCRHARGRVAARVEPDGNCLINHPPYANVIGPQSITERVRDIRDGGERKAFVEALTAYKGDEFAPYVADAIADAMDRERNWDVKGAMAKTIEILRNSAENPRN